MKKRAVPLEIKDIASSNLDALPSWRPDSREQVFLGLDLEIGLRGERASNMFHVRVATPEALRRHGGGFCMVKHRTLVISDFDWKQLTALLDDIVRDCARGSWEESCAVLQRYFNWEYEDYSA
ncbi:Imm8 family immunity protein [Achromobacter sp. 413638]|uniref:Imm8 family immunity protein n=1 Tax=Achromobacter sp. 413638 TaxID=3342385 RepID=UPI00370C0879